MKRISVLLLVLVLAGCLSTPSEQAVRGAISTDAAPGAGAQKQAVQSPVIVTLTTSDAVQLKGTYYPPKDTTVKAAALLLLHEAFTNRKVWDSFVKVAQEGGYAVLTVDLRGHGQSGGEKTFDSSMDNDVDAALAWLKASPDVDGNRMGIVGASLGANLALRGGARYPEIKSVIMLSPGMQLWKIGIDKAIVEYGARPLLLVASKDDAYPAGTVQTLSKKALGDHQLQIYPGKEHGTKILISDPDLAALMLNWLKKTIQ
jgi:dienelactone hydrolase